MPFHFNTNGEILFQNGLAVDLSQEIFEDCCCPGCQWKLTYQWNCNTGVWDKMVEQFSSPAVQPENTVVYNGDCVFYLFGEVFTNCNVDPIPPLPTHNEPPPYPGDCCTEPPDSDCQEEWVFDWNCDDEIWELVGESAVPSQWPIGHTITNGLQRVIYGAAIDCSETPPANHEPDPGTDPPPDADDLCPPPSTCPCTNWLPSEWPCGGLVEQYVVVAEKISYGTSGGTCNFGLRTAGVIVTASAVDNRRCFWTGSGVGESTEDKGITWASTTVTISVELLQDAGVWKWRIIMGGSVGGFSFGHLIEKTDGLTPLGDYSRGDAYCGYVTGSVT